MDGSGVIDEAVRGVRRPVGPWTRSVGGLPRPPEGGAQAEDAGGCPLVALPLLWGSRAGVAVVETEAAAEAGPADADGERSTDLVPALAGTAPPEASQLAPGAVPQGSGDEQQLPCLGRDLDPTPREQPRKARMIGGGVGELTGHPNAPEDVLGSQRVRLPDGSVGVTAQEERQAVLASAVRDDAHEAGRGVVLARAREDEIAGQERVGRVPRIRREAPEALLELGEQLAGGGGSGLLGGGPLCSSGIFAAGDFEARAAEDPREPGDVSRRAVRVA